jgi:sec-independent protein translocase protein TatB
MFDFAWSEIALIGVVALIAIGPKDMPVAIRTAAKALKKARAMAAEFQTHIDEMVRDAELGDVKNQLNSLRNMNVSRVLDRTIDRDGTLRKSFAAPMETTVKRPSMVADAAVVLVDLRPARAICTPPDFSRSRFS